MTDVEARQLEQALEREQRLLGVKLRIDEMFPATLAEQLGARGHDVALVHDPAQAGPEARLATRCSPPRPAPGGRCSQK